MFEDYANNHKSILIYTDAIINAAQNNDITFVNESNTALLKFQSISLTLVVFTIYKVEGKAKSTLI